jgi:class 3 adenylate cyclase
VHPKQPHFGNREFFEEKQGGERAHTEKRAGTGDVALRRGDAPWRLGDWSGASQEQAIVGETPNLAARLQGVAEPNSVLVADGTRKLLGNLFELNDLGAMDLKGIAGPVRAWAALRPASIRLQLYWRLP